MTPSEASNSPARYRFAPRDTTGWLLGLGPTQCLSLAGGLLVAVLVLRAGAPLMVAGVATAIGAALAFVPVGGAPACETAVVAAGYLARGRSREWTQGDCDESRSAAPAVFGDLLLVRAASGGPLGGGGVVVDSTRRTLTAVLRVRGREFALVESCEQARLVGLWGDVLGGFCTERSPVVRISVSEWAAPQGLDAHLAHLGERAAADANSAAMDDYRSLVGSAGSMATGHETLLAVTVAASRLGARQGQRGDWITPATETLGEQVRLLDARLGRAALVASAPLSAPEVAASVRSRLAPDTVVGMPVGPSGMWPSSWRAGWQNVAVDDWVHAVHWVREWPRLEVGPGWLEPLVLHSGAPRTLTLIFEPLAPSRSVREVERDAIRVATDETQRARGGWRVGARQARTRDEIASREAELVAGYPELGFWGLLSVAAPDPAALERVCAEYEQAAAAAGLCLGRLDGRHDLALAATLPLGVGPSRPVLG